VKILSNKFFIIGNLILLLIAIPVTLYFVKKQEEVRSRATSATKLYFTPSSINTQSSCQSFNVDVMVDPGTNLVSIVNLYVTYDPTVLSVSQITPSDVFKTVQRAASISSGKADIEIDAVAGDITKAVSSVTKVVTITFVPKGTGNAQIAFDGTKTQVYSVAPTDAPTENVLIIGSLAPANVTVSSDACLNGPTSAVVSPTGTLNASVITPTGTSTSTTSSTNQTPICTALLVNPSTTGAAPFSVLFTGQGNDPDTGGLINKATFTFGDGQTQDATLGLNLQTVNTQMSHTYNTAGTYTASVAFTDNQGGISQANSTCTQAITVTASSSATLSPTATIAPTATPTLVEKPTVTPTLVEKPTIAATGSIAQTMGTLGVIVMSIVGGFFLLTL